MSTGTVCISLYVRSMLAALEKDLYVRIVYTYFYVCCNHSFCRKQYNIPHMHHQETHGQTKKIWRILFFYTSSGLSIIHTIANIVGCAVSELWITWIKLEKVKRHKRFSPSVALSDLSQWGRMFLAHVQCTVTADISTALCFMGRLYE